MVHFTRSKELAGYFACNFPKPLSPSLPPNSAYRLSKNDDTDEVSSVSFKMVGADTTAEVCTVSIAAAEGAPAMTPAPCAETRYKGLQCGEDCSAGKRCSHRHNI